MSVGEFLFLLKGLQWTLALSAIGFVCGGVAGLAVALARTSSSSIMERTTASYIAVFQGTPQLKHYNPLGSVHGGWYATLLDSALGCAIHSTLPQSVG